MLMMGDSSYSNHSGRSEYRTEWTPYSAVSSFNYPATCDSSLTTPNTTIHPQSMPLRMAPIKQEAPSPSTGPSYQYYPDDGFTDMRCRSPMKFRDPSTTKPAVTSNNETDYPPSPFFSHEPYYGNFSVSAGSSSSFPTSGMTASPVMGTHGHHQSLAQLPLPQPSQLSAGGYRSQYQAPILIAPDPRSRKPSTTSTQIGSRRQGSLDSSLSTPRSTHAVQGPGGSPYLKSQETTSNANRQRKRKTPTQGPLGNESDGESSGGDPTEHLLLVQLRDNEGLPWKVVQDEFNKRTGQDKKIPCLEMRLKRHRERTRRWTEVDERALKNAHNSYKKNKYEHISHLMLKYGCEDRWTKEAVKKKLEAMYPDGSPQPSNAPVRRRRRRGENEFNIWSYRRDSLHDAGGRTNAMPGSNGTPEIRRRLPSEILQSQQLRPLQFPSQQGENQQQYQSLPATTQQNINFGENLGQPRQNIWGLERP